MRILTISSTFPYPPTKGGTHNRTFNLVKPIAQNHEVTLITQRPEDVKEEDVEALRSHVAELVVFPPPNVVDSGRIAKIKRFIQFLRQGTPSNVLFLYSSAIQEWIDQAVADDRFDAITCEHSVNEVYVRPQWREKIKTAIDVHSSVYRTCKNQLETNTSDHPWRDRLYLPLLEKYESRSLKKFSHVVVTTDEDELQMRQFDPQARVTLVPNGVDLDSFPYRTKDPEGHHLVFVGGLDYFVNIDAACFFSLEVLPKIQEKYPDTTLTLVGSKPAPEVQALTRRKGITVTGRVPSVAEYIHQGTVFVAPLRTGFGMKIKTLEAMAAGAPVVGSDRGLEGLAVNLPQQPPKALRANTVAEYVAAISRLFDNPLLRQELSKNARAWIEAEYTWKRAASIYEAALLG
jgi:glycosyltransferase involved in cell wall biosynthesis